MSSELNEAGYSYRQELKMIHKRLQEIESKLGSKNPKKEIMERIDGIEERIHKLEVNMGHIVPYNVAEVKPVAPVEEDEIVEAYKKWRRYKLEHFNGECEQDLWLAICAHVERKGLK